MESYLDERAEEREIDTTSSLKRLHDLMQSEPVRKTQAKDMIIFCVLMVHYLQQEMDSSYSLSTLTGQTTERKQETLAKRVVSADI